MAAAARRRNGRIFILLALVLIVLLAAVVFLFRDQFLPQTPQVIEAPVEPAPQIELVEIVVLAQPVARDTVLREEMLASVLYPQSEMIAGMFYTDKNAILNKHTRYDLGQGTPLTPSLLSENPLGSEAAVQIPAVWWLYQSPSTEILQWHMDFSQAIMSTSLVPYYSQTWMLTFRLDCRI
jgi:hypothetical protein